MGRSSRAQALSTPAARAGETGFEDFETPLSLFDRLCGSRLFWLALAFWTGSSVGAGFVLCVEVVASW